MKTRTLLEKLRSTKLWCALAGIVLGAALALGVDGAVLEKVLGAVTALVSAVTYIVTEGAVDAAGAKSLGEGLGTLLSLFAGKEPRMMELETIPCREDNHGSRRTEPVSYLVVHYTAGNGDTARDNGRYFARCAVGASAHYFVDKTRVVASVAEENVAWHCGASITVTPAAATETPSAWSCAPSSGTGSMPSRRDRGKRLVAFGGAHAPV